MTRTWTAIVLGGALVARPGTGILLSFAACPVAVVQPPRPRAIDAGGAPWYLKKVPHKPVKCVLEGCAAVKAEQYEP
jgi:hypothetical protein